MLSMKCDPNNRLEKVAEYNFKIISPAHRIDFVMSITMGWVFENPNKPLTNLEDFFRKEELDIYLLAMKNNLNKEKYKLVKLDGFSEKAEYMLFYSCKKKENAIKEIESIWGSYEENYKHINNSGIVVPINFNYDKDLLKNTNLKDIEVDEDDTHELLRYNKIKIEIKIENLEQNFTRYLQMAEDDKIELEPKIIDYTKDGSYILGVFYGEELYCRVGVIIKENKDGGNNIKYVDLSDKFNIGSK